MAGSPERVNARTDDRQLERVQSVLAHAHSVGFVTDEQDPVAAVRDALQWLGLSSLAEAEAEFLEADEVERLAVPGVEMEDLDDEPSTTGWPPFDGGTHSKGGLYGVENDYFGEDWEPRE
jgi:hypothetical protein